MKLSNIYLHFWVHKFQYLVLIILVTIILSACSDRQGTVSNPLSENVSNGSGSTLSEATGPDNNINISVTPQSEATTADQSEIPVQATEVTRLRAQFAGVTFLYSPDLINNVRMERVPGADNAPDGNGIPQSVVFVFESESDAQSPVLVVNAIRQSNGLFYDALPENVRTETAELESIIQDPQLDGPNAQVIGFVNGQGLRTVVQERGKSTYTFNGITHDVRYAVEFTFPVEVNTADSNIFEPDLNQLDAVIETLYIDGGAESLNVTTCVDDAEYITSLTIPDGTEIMPGETFVKTWRMRNTGTCTWTKNYSWTFKGGDVLTLMDTTVIDLVLPGEEVDISVTLVVPESPGIYAGQWQLSGVNHFEEIGPEVYYLITVPEA